MAAFITIAWRLWLLFSTIANGPTSPLQGVTALYPVVDMCQKDPQLLEMVRNTESLVKEIHNRCYKLHSDIFQRVSGHLVKHKMEDYCALTLALLLEGQYVLEAMCADVFRMVTQTQKQRQWLRVTVGKTPASTRRYLGPEFGEGRQLVLEYNMPVKFLDVNNFDELDEIESRIDDGKNLAVPKSARVVAHGIGKMKLEHGEKKGEPARNPEVVNFLVSGPNGKVENTNTQKLVPLDYPGLDPHEIKNLLSRMRTEAAFDKLQDLHNLTKLLLEDFSTGEHWRIQLLRYHENAENSWAKLSQQPQDVWNLVTTIASDTFNQMLEVIGDVVNYHLANFNIRNLQRLVTQLNDFPQLVQPHVHNFYHPVRGEKHCRSVLGFDLRRDPLMARRRMFTDVSGLFQMQPAVMDHLEAYTEQLSYTIVAIQPRAVIGAEALQDTYRKEFGRNESEAGEAANKMRIRKDDLACNATGLAYTPSKCLFDAGWGSMTFTVNTEPPFDATLTVSEMTERLVDIDWRRSSHQLDRPSPFVQPVSNGSASYEDILDNVDSVYKTLNHPTPDFMFISPMVGNCLMMEKLGRSKSDLGTNRKRDPQLAPKLVAVPINPLIPPPYRFAPDFAQWHENDLHSDEVPEDVMWTYVQCSVSSAVEVLAKQGYELLQIDHTFALFGRKLGPATKFKEGPLKHSELWLQGWHCSVAADSLQELTWRSGMDTEVLVDNSVHPLLRHQEICRFRDRFQLPLEAGFTDIHCDTITEKLNQEMEVDIDSIEGMVNDVRREEFALAMQDYHFLKEAGFNHSSKISLALISTKSKKSEYKMDPDVLGTLHWRNDLSLFETINTHKMHDPKLFLRTWDLQMPKNELGKKFMLESEERGRCLDDLGVCECFVPYRGRFCEIEEPLLSMQPHMPFKAALHYLVGENVRLISDMKQSLQILWKNFNRFYEYPVVVFHDGLSEKSKKDIIEASSNSIWFALVEDYTAIPKHLENKIPQSDFAGYRIGYRGMCRFRSGPIFLHPLLKKFDYAWTLDTDGYFPGRLERNPIEMMHFGGFVYSYSHISRDQASQVQHFWEFTRLYLEHRKIDMKRTRIMRRITDALVMRDTYWHEWNRLLFMNDIELVRLDFFRSDQYQDYFRFLDSLGGFWLYRWGDHGIRTIAVSLHLDEKYITRLDIPYAHQEACVCSGIRGKCVKRKDAKRFSKAELAFRQSDADVSRSYKYECVKLRDDEEESPDDQRFGVVDEVRFFGGE